MKNNKNLMLSLALSFSLVSCMGGGQLREDPILGGGGNTGNNQEEVPTSTAIYNENLVSGTVTIQFNDGSSKASASLMRNLVSENTASPSSYKIKIISAYVTENINSVTEANEGQTFTIFENEECQGHLMQCDVSNGTDEQGNPFAYLVTDYFDLADPESVNEALNAQRQQILPGTYRYARLEFSKTSPAFIDTDNVIWEYGTSGELGFVGHSGAVTLQFPAPITIEETSAVTFIINYSLSGTITFGDPEPSGAHCTTIDSEKVCFLEPEITPNVIVR